MSEIQPHQLPETTPTLYIENNPTVETTKRYPPAAFLYCEEGIKWATKIWAEFVRERGGEVKAERELEWGFGCLEL